MLIKNWMKRDPITLSSNMLAVEAMKIFDQHNLRFIPVIEDGRLRGILARRDLREAASHVIETEDISEINFFNKNVKVKDLMVRKPITLNIDDRVETAMKKGAELGRSFFPVMDGDKLVGTVSDIDIFNSFYQILGIEENLSGLTIEITESYGVQIKRILQDLFSAGVEIYRLFTLTYPESKKRRLLLRFPSEFLETAHSTCKNKGYIILEAVKAD